MTKLVIMITKNNFITFYECRGKIICYLGPRYINLLFFLGPQNPSLAQAFEPNEDHRNPIISLAFDLGNQWVEEATIWKPRN